MKKLIVVMACAIAINTNLKAQSCKDNGGKVHVAHDSQGNTLVQCKDGTVRTFEPIERPHKEPVDKPTIDRQPVERPHREPVDKPTKNN